MKKLCLMLIMASLALVVMHGSNRFSALGTASAGNAATVTLTNYASTSQGQITLCFNAKGAYVSCTAKGAAPVPFFVANTGQTTADSLGNSCETSDAGYYIVGDTTPSINQVQYTVGTLLHFNSATQTGDSAFTTWVGPGKCNGATFVPGKGAVVTNTGTVHFVNSSKRSRSDSIVTSFTNVPKGSNGSFLLTGTLLLQ